MSLVLQRSLGGTHLRNAGGTKNVPPGNAFFQLAHAIIPICGFGTFNPASTFNSLSYWNPTQIGGANYTGLVFNEVWPNIFLTLTETLSAAITSSFGGSPSTQYFNASRVTNYSQFTDTFCVQTTVDPGGFLFNDNGFTSGASAQFGADYTSMTQDWTFQANPPGVIFAAYHYTAQLSNQLNGLAMWPSWVAQAVALLNSFSFPAWAPAGDAGIQGVTPGTPTPVSFGFWLQPVSGGGYAAITTAESPFVRAVMGASKGMALRMSNLCVPNFQGNALSVIGQFGNTIGPSFLLADTELVNSWVQDSANPSSIAATGIQPNSGALICSKSRWQLPGNALSGSGRIPPIVSYNHLGGLWAQPLRFNGSQPGMIDTYPQYRQAANPAQIWDLGPMDVSAALAASGDAYGMLGFRAPPGAVGGAGGTGPGSGGGAPPV